jgi:copper chaperone CopZ
VADDQGGYIGVLKMAEAILQIRGMHCNSCARLIELELKDLDGVEKVKADYEAGNASVTYDPVRVDTGALEKAVREAGYEVIS